ncbi:MAG: 2-amino-4-hydroxy-6-hydroxymethyldihydropteridine diphosphokinase [Chloroflexi bacterium]|nr:2-amino-4-hydroxy-6-hydroxymethyldihydropteridine diphosphokinase [Chloroflexota bacterium]
MQQIFLGLGTNLGQRRHNLAQAVVGLQDCVVVSAVSPLYETEPWGVTDQPAFLNLCLSAYTHHSPQKLLICIKNLEQEMGRQPTHKWGPRLIDIDILLYEDVVLQTNDLTIPHPCLPDRAFVLCPLADIAADVLHPALGQTIEELATAVNSTTVHRLEEPLTVPIAV